MAERRLFVRPECKFRGLQPYMDGEESRDAGWRRAGLMAAAQRGDADAYGELLNEIGPVLMRFLHARVRDAQEAEDLYQETLMAIHRARHGYDAARAVRAVAVRHCPAHRRRARRAAPRAPGARGAGRRPARAACGERRPPEAELEQALRRLSGEQRQAIALLRVEGLPVEAGACRAGTTTGALRVRFHRACKMLRQLL